ncbi:Flp pilus assembly complex ATPase component TadA (plasmid) [Burkholderia aenigmatica]|uniref:ATPase, T2SS/T4P/T4SS family n=1 Tax=Burkholderia aenigmatica TaxID=2015348 RepID=UPI001F18AE45|nr:ATPase, T2SS/T4P/T4SS family [Burkholderia aenigmatica]UKD18108.1 Flp pilus assembly complex ATPase component TadA [Burkholderia aenigmatica]
MRATSISGASMNLSNVEPYDSSVTVRNLMESAGIAELRALTGNTEIAINRPGEGWTETRDGWLRHELPGASLDALMKLANALAIYNKVTPPLSVDDPEKPVRLPNGERGQIVIPPACEPNTVSMTIRIPSATRLSVGDLTRGNFLNDFRIVGTQDASFLSANPNAPSFGDLSMNSSSDVVDSRRQLAAPAAVVLQRFELDMLDALAQRDMGQFLTLAMLHRMNVVLVGGVGSGKTTLMKALADIVPSTTRVATIEDTHEVPLPNQPNHVHLFFSESLPARRIVKATLRMKFDRVYLAELRGDETWDYLVLLNTGHQGGITTVHANDAISALARIATLVKQSPVGQTLTWEFILREVKSTIDVVLFMENKCLKEVYFDPVGKWKLLRGLA